MKDPQRLLNQLLKLKREFEDQGRQLPPGIAGTYGEILAYKKLKEKLGKYVSVRLFSGQRGADIEIARAQKKLELEESAALNTNGRESDGIRSENSFSSSAAF